MLRVSDRCHPVHDNENLLFRHNLGGNSSQEPIPQDKMPHICAACRPKILLIQTMSSVLTNSVNDFTVFSLNTEIIK